MIRNVLMFCGILMLTLSSCSKKKMEALQTELNEYKADCINKVNKLEEEKRSFAWQHRSSQA